MSTTAGAAVTAAPPDAHAPALHIGGLTPLSTVDWPGRLAAVVFCQGCPWRCRYCHNTDLLGTTAAASLDSAQLITFLERRRGLLDGVVFSGGEPTAQRGLAAVIERVRALGFAVGLHTAGCYPQRLAALLPRLDWIGLDIKAVAEDYRAVTGVAGSGERAWTSLRLLRDAGTPFEVRVTVHDALLPAQRLRRLRDRLHGAGIANVVLQRCRTTRMHDPSLGANAAALVDDRRVFVATAAPGGA
ncbi:MAG: anaerobic ribonucleoside-triphosphate reductase activating protein [Gammaproteobacteria bacterium]|nr:anaerobic ribonucleoside-triphosphate reductase activating protein [Gammaproteobacteria bacterium]